MWHSDYVCSRRASFVLRGFKEYFYVKKIRSFESRIRLWVDQETGEDKQARLFDLTSQKRSRTMLHDEERPRNVCTEQLALAEQIGAAGIPSLIPEHFEHQVETFGLCADILAEDDFVWNMRILKDGSTGRKYGYSEAASSSAPDKTAEVLALIDNRLKAQEKRGSRFLVSDALSAADLYWATMGMSVIPASPEIMPSTQQNKGMLRFFENNAKISEIANVLSKTVEEHQNYILTTFWG